MECTICLTARVPPWFTCPECGHLLCDICIKCLPEPHTCPTCRSALPNDLRNNVALQRQAIETMPDLMVTCRHSKCDAQVTLAAASVHDQHCAYQPRSGPALEHRHSHPGPSAPPPPTRRRRGHSVAETTQVPLRTRRNKDNEFLFSMEQCYYFLGFSKFIVPMIILLWLIVALVNQAREREEFIDTMLSQEECTYCDDNGCFSRCYRYGGPCEIICETLPKPESPPSSDNLHDAIMGNTGGEGASATVWTAGANGAVLDSNGGDGSISTPSFTWSRQIGETYVHVMTVGVGAAGVSGSILVAGGGDGASCVPDRSRVLQTNKR